MCGAGLGGEWEGVQTGSGFLSTLGILSSSSSASAPSCLGLNALPRLQTSEMSLINTVPLSRGAVPWGWVREKGSLRGRQWQPRKIVMHPRREESPGAPAPLLPPLLLIVSIKATGTVTEERGPKGDGSRVHSANYNNCYLMLCVFPQTKRAYAVPE